MAETLSETLTNLAGVARAFADPERADLLHHFADRAALEADRSPSPPDAPDAGE